MNYKFKFPKFLLLSLFIVLLISLGNVYATDNYDLGSNDALLLDDSSSSSHIYSSEDDDSIYYNTAHADLVSNGVSEDDSQVYKNLYSENNYYVLEGDSFESIQYAIDSVEENTTIVLQGIASDGKQSNFYGNGSQIVINKSITLDGKGSTLDAKYLSRIFYITANNVTLRNLNLINANHRDYDNPNIFPNSCYPYDFYGLGTEGDNGGVIKWLGDDGCLENSVFSNNLYAGFGKKDGRVISWEGKGGSIRNSFFGTNFMIYNGAIDGMRYESKIIDAPIYGDYTGELIDNNIFIKNASVNCDYRIHINNISRYFGNSEKASINLTADDGFVFSNVNTYLNISNDKISKVINCSSNSQGIVNFNVNDLPVGTYDFLVKFNDFSFNSTLTIEKAPVKFVLSSYKAAYDSPKKFNVKLLNSKDNSTVSGVKISLKLYTGKSYKTLAATTNSKGIASFSLSKNTVGKHKIIVSASENVVSAKKNSSITITKASANVKLSKTTFKYKKSDYLKMTLTNKNTKKPISKLTVKVKVYTGKSYKTYSLKTDKNGIIKINTKGLKKGSHKIVISLSSKYYALSKTAAIKVK